MSKSLFESLALGLFIFIATHLAAQSVGINTNSPHPSAALEVYAGDKGLLIPRMTSAERSGIMSPANGLLVYDTTTESFWYYKTSLWIEISKGVFENTGGLVHNTGNHGTDDFVFGSPALPGEANLSDTLMFFDKSKGAFRAGMFSNSNAWAPDSIGRGSIAFGRNAKASGYYSAAMGNNTEANGQNSTAMGAISNANGFCSIATGSGTNANGFCSIATGFSTNANGTNSFSLGSRTTSRAAYSMALGRYNVGAGDSINWVATDPLFEIGIGTLPSNRKNALTVIKNGDFIVGGAFVPPVTSITDTLMYFDKSKGALRAGELLNSNAWAPDSIGRSSFAAGRNAKASGDFSISLGESTAAIKSNSIALGKNSLASGINAIAGGVSTISSGIASISLGAQTTATGYGAVALGYDTDATADYAFAAGQITLASGTSSVALGSQTTATRTASTALGIQTNATGSFSLSTGRGTRAKAYNTTANGSYNVGLGTETSWVSADPILEVGVGIADNNRKNALTIFKNGDFVVGGHTLPPAALTTDTLIFFDRSKGAFRQG
jgi:hypothetical protein